MKPERLLQTGSPRARELLASLAEDVPPDPTGGAERVLRALDVPPDLVARGARPAGFAARRYVPFAAIVAVVAVSAFTGLALRSGAPAERAASMYSAPPSDSPFVTPAAEPHGPANLDHRATTPIDTPTTESAPSNTTPIGADVATLPPAAVEPPKGTNLQRPIVGHARGVRGASSRGAVTAPSATSESARGTTDELQLLERAQAAAARGRAGDALALVAEHRRAFPRGSFVLEMSVIEIEALAREGQIDEAAARGERLLASHPDFPYARRVEAVIRMRGRKEPTR